MRRVACFVCLFLLAGSAACHRKDNPVAPSGTAPSGEVLLQFGLSVRRQPNSYSLTVKGQSGSDDLIRALPLAEPLKDNESWSGAVMRLLEWTTSTAITTNEPFTPPAKDHFQFNDVPSTGSVDISLEIIPGGQPTGGPFHNIRVRLDSDHIALPSGYRVETGNDGRTHVKGPLPK